MPSVAIEHTAADDAERPIGNAAAHTAGNDSRDTEQPGTGKEHHA